MGESFEELYQADYLPPRLTESEIADLQQVLADCSFLSKLKEMENADSRNNPVNCVI